MRMFHRPPVLLAAAFLGLLSGCAAAPRPEAAEREAAQWSLVGWLGSQGLPVVSRAAWGANAPVRPTREHRITRITIHHTATRLDTARSLEAKLRALQQFSQRDDSLADGRRKPAWADVPYHFYVAADGRVGEAREWRWVGDSNTPYDPTGHLLVVIEGNFEREQLTAAQRATMDRLIPALARRFGVPPERLASHKDFAQTACPGENVYRELPRWRELMGDR